MRMNVATLSPNQKKGRHNLGGTMLLETLCFFSVPQMGLTSTTTPSNLSRAKQERMKKVATTFKWAPIQIPSHAPTLEPQNWSKTNIISRGRCAGGSLSSCTWGCKIHISANIGK